VSRVRGLSTVASFVVFLTAFAVIMFSIFFFYDLLRGEAQRGVAAVQSSVVRDVSVKFFFDGAACGLEGGPYIYYVALREGVVAHQGVNVVCPPGLGMYRYIGVERSGDVGYADVYVGSLIVDAVADKPRHVVSAVGDEFFFTLYLKIFNNSSGWAPSLFEVALDFDGSLLDCRFESGGTSLSLGPSVVSPAGLETRLLGVVACRAVAPFHTTTINVHTKQQYLAHQWTHFAPAVVMVINRTASEGPPPPGGACVFTPTAGSRFGSPSGLPSDGFNELNGWVAAWDGGGGGVVVALMPGIAPPDSTGTGYTYTVRLENVQIGTLSITEAATVSVLGAMPAFMQAAEIRVGSYTVYADGTSYPQSLAPGSYPVYATLQARPEADWFGHSATLQLRCTASSSSVYSITLRVPNPEEWGLRAEIYTTSPLVTVPPLPIGGSGYAYRGAWSVGGIYIYLSNKKPEISLVSPYFTHKAGLNIAPKWAAYWINPSGISWQNYAIKYVGRLYVPWSNIRVGVWRDDGAYVKLCDVDTGAAWWATTGAPQWDWRSGLCAGAPPVEDVEVGFFERSGGSALIFVVGEDIDNGRACIPTIDGAWCCDQFKWNDGKCKGGWSFLQASSDAVPYFVADKYTHGSSDGGGTPRP